jgi:hypothetical protein
LHRIARIDLRLMRARPFSVSMAGWKLSVVQSLRRPEDDALFTGTLSFMRFSSKVTSITCKE